MTLSDGQPAAAFAGSAQQPALPHISVCICTYRRPGPLRRLLGELNRQVTGGRFTYSIMVADNEEERSGEAAVTEARLSSKAPIHYCVEPVRGIAMARNKVVANAHGDFLAFIDDDEFPIQDWLLKLFEACEQHHADGVLGPVLRHFDDSPPAWLVASSLYIRRVHATGTPVYWREARTGNVLIRRRVVEGDPSPFRPEFRAGEDHDFFRRKSEQGFRFIWSSDAEVFEAIPPARWKRMYFVRKALLQGATAAQQPDFGAAEIAKSLVAVPLYTAMLPMAFLFGQTRFMTLAVKLSSHAGKLLKLAHINPVREEYISD